MQFLPQPQLKFDCEPFRGCQIPYQTDSEDFLQFVPNCTKPCKSIPHTPTVTVFWQKLICALDQLQSVFNASAKLLCGCQKCDSVTPLACNRLNWLPVPLHIEFKLCLLTDSMIWYLVIPLISSV